MEGIQRQKTYQATILEEATLLSRDELKKRRGGLLLPSTHLTDVDIISALEGHAPTRKVST